MALPSALLLSPSPQELTFIAEEELIEIVPSFSMSPVRLISVSRYSLSRTSRYFGVVLTLFCLQGVYGPFQPPAKAVVPLWLALSLKPSVCKVSIPFTVETRLIFQDLLFHKKTLKRSYKLKRRTRTRSLPCLGISLK
jgi:hypothetical protein